MMKKKFRAKVSGAFDIVQLSDTTFSEVVEKAEREGLLNRPTVHEP